MNRNFLIMVLTIVISLSLLFMNTGCYTPPVPDWYWTRLTGENEPLLAGTIWILNYSSPFSSNRTHTIAFHPDGVLHTVEGRERSRTWERTDNNIRFIMGMSDFPYLFEGVYNPVSRTIVGTFIIGNSRTLYGFTMTPFNPMDVR